MKVQVRDGNVERALRKLNKQLTESGKLLEVREREQYTKPSVIERERHKSAVKRWDRHIAQQTLPKKMY